MITNALTFLAIFILAVIILRSVRLEFTSYSTKLIGKAVVQLGDKRGVPAVRMQIKQDGVDLTVTETFRTRALAEEAFSAFNRDAVQRSFDDIKALL